MAKKLSFLVKKIFLSSLAGIIVNDSSGAHNNNENEILNLADQEFFSISKDKDLTPKLLLKKNNTGIIAVSHRSHRSHSSHRSHYSSSSGSSSSRTSRPSSTRPSSSSSTKPSSSSSSNNKPLRLLDNPAVSKSSLPYTFKPNQTNPSNSADIIPVNIRLGDRNLKRGMSGSDVTELINILIKKGYLKLANEKSQVYGTYQYDETIEAVIKRYQLDNGLTSDGTCGPLTVYHLLNK